MTTASIKKSIQVFDLNKKKQLTFAIKKQLGEGSFGQAYLAESLAYKKPLVYKCVDLQANNDYIHYSPHQLLRLTYREVDYLQQLGLLVGYQHDKINKKMHIIMHYLPGTPEYYIAPKLRRLAEFYSFCALRNLHRKGIAHMDPHECNFLFDEKSEKATVIDFGFAQNTHLFRQIRDFYIFLNMRRAKPSLLTQAGRDTLWYFIDFYCTELKNYILANRFEAAQTVFCYAVVIIAAVCGASMLGIASILAQELIRAMLLPSLSQLLEALQDHYELRAFNQKQKGAMRCLYYGVIGVMITLQGLLLALQVITLQNCFSSLFSQLSNLGEACIHSQQFFQTCLQAFPLEELGKTLIHLQPWVHICQYWFNNAEKYLFDDDKIAAHYQHKIAHPNKLFLPLFKQQTLSNKLREATPLVSPGISLRL